MFLLLRVKFLETLDFLGQIIQGIIQLQTKKKLAKLLERVEEDPEFIKILEKHIKQLRPKFESTREQAMLKKLVNLVFN